MKKRSRWESCLCSIASIFFIATSSACSDIEERSLLNNSEIAPSSMNTEAMGGQGWNSETEVIMGNCIEGSTQVAGSNQASVVFNSNISKEQLYNTLGFSFSAKAKSSIYRGNAAAQFAAANSEDKFSAVTMFSAQYKFKNEIFLPNGRLTETGEKIAKRTQSDVNAWMRFCGNEYVAQIQKGAQLIYSARIDFLSEEDKSKFNSEIGISGPLTSLTASIQKTAERFASSALITISAYQMGGDASQLSRAFTYTSGTGEVPLIRCSMANLEPCLETLESLIRYASDEDGFPSQIKNNGQDGGSSDNLYITMPYGSAGVFWDSDLLVRRLVASQRRDIEAKLEENILIQNRRAFFTKVSLNSSEKTLEIRNQLNDAYSRNQRLISEAVSTCYDTLYLESQTAEQMRANCINAVDRLNSEFIPLPVELLTDLATKCDEGYVSTENGCRAVQCANGFYYGENWTKDLLNDAGVANYTCNKEAVESLISVDCNTDKFFQPKDDSGRELLTCNPKPCYDNSKLRQHGDTWRVKILGGENLMICSYGDFKLQATICDADYKLSESSCKPEKEVEVCDAPNGSQVARGNFYFEQKCSYSNKKNKVHQLIETGYRCNKLARGNFELVSVSTKVIGQCGQNWQNLF